MKARGVAIVGSLVCAWACSAEAPQAAVVEVPEEAPEDHAEAPGSASLLELVEQGAPPTCLEVPDGMRRVRVPVDHPTEHIEQGSQVDLVFVAELRGAKIQREDRIAMPLLSGVEVACVRDRALELLVWPAEAPALAASLEHGVVHALGRAAGDTARPGGQPHVKLNTLMERYVSHWSEGHQSGAPIRLHEAAHAPRGLEALTAHEPGSVVFTLPRADLGGLRAGDRVDVILGTQVPSLEKGSHQMVPAGVVFAQGVKLEAVGARSVGLLVTREVAAELAVASRSGTWTLATRAPGDVATDTYPEARLSEHLTALEVLWSERERR
jgi:hypothetical protein